MCFDSIISVEYWINEDFKNNEVDLTPFRKNPNDSGFDLKNAMSFYVMPNKVYTVRTGVHIALPEGFEAVVRPISGLAEKHGIKVLNSPGTIDQDYRGEIKVLLYMNPTFDHISEKWITNRSLCLESGSRIAQLVIQKRQNIQMKLSDPKNETERGEKGFGSSGIK